MAISNGWIIRALIQRLQQPGMKVQRRFVLGASLLLAIFLVGAIFYIFRQPTEDALEMAALKTFAALGLLIVILICAAIFVRKRTGAKWTTQQALEDGSRKQGVNPDQSL